MVHKKLMAARVALQGKKLTKTGLNKFAGYKYFELGDFLPEIQTIFNDLGLCGVVSYGVTEATLCITDVDDGTIIVISSPMAAAELKGAHPIQNLGAIETYQRRYLWMTAMEIVEHDVIDSGPPKTGLEDLSLRVGGKDVVKTSPSEATPVPIPAGALFNTQKRIKGDTLPPPHVEPVAWTIIIDDTVEDWNSLLIDATTLKLSFATSDEQVKEMYKVNRSHYDKVKAESPEVHAEIMDMFKTAKAKFKD
jgi:hypothetical protein